MAGACDRDTEGAVLRVHASTTALTFSAASGSANARDHHQRIYVDHGLRNVVGHRWRRPSGSAIVKVSELTPVPCTGVARRRKAVAITRPH